MNKNQPFMMTKDQRKEYARVLYTTERLTQEEIAERVGVTRATIGRWVKAEHWEDLRTSLTITKEEQLKHIYKQLANLNDDIAQREVGKRFATPAEADTMVKYAATIQKMENDVGLTEIISVMRKFSAFLRSHDLNEAKRLVPIMDVFIKSHLN